MNKKNWLYIGIAAVVLIIAIITIYFLFGKNTSAKKAQQAGETFTEQLKKGNYTKLSENITAKSLRSSGFSKSAVADKYATIYPGIGIKDIKVSQLKTQKNGSKYALTYALHMSTSLGKLKTQTYKTTVSKENDTWKVDWNPSLIFPEMSKNDKVRMSTDEAKRGDILDRNDKKLATLGEFKDAGIVPENLGSGEEKNKNIQAISKKFAIPEKDITNALSQKWVKPDSFVPIKTILDGKYPELQGLTYAQKQLRTYPLNKATAHLLGYVGEVSAEDIKKNPSLNTGDIIGKAGLERYYDKKLRGQNGGEIKIINEITKNEKTLQKVARKDGMPIKLTINADIQKKAYESLSNENGAVTMINPKNGDLLALVSTPSYDANLMTSGISATDYAKYNQDKNTPFLPRYATRYAPGSTFKTITAAIGLDLGITKPDKTRKITGLKWQKDSSWGKYFVTRVHEKNPVNMVDALVYSDNIYFAQEGLDIGKNRLEAGLKKFDFNTDFHLPITMQPAQISNNGLNRDILLADTAYGQGELLMNPIQQAIAYSAIANQGKMTYPRLLTAEKQGETKQAVNSSSADTIRDALKQTVSNPAGTAHKLQIQGRNIAAKTGTAELKQKQGEDGLENGFLYAFDTDNPDYLMVGMIENVKGRGGSGLVIDKLKPLVESMY